MPADLAIEANYLTKRYGDFTAVDSLNLSIEEGRIFGLLGPNGAGKTTVILMLLGLTEPSSGSCRVCGFDPLREPLKVKRLIGYLPERIGFYENLTALENLKYVARLNKFSEEDADKRIDEALFKVGLGDNADADVSTFSKGMKQRLGIANVLFKGPRVVILDEPTQGIDPKGIDELLNLFLQINRDEGITILLSSHLMHQVQKVCDDVGIMVGGNMVIRGAIDDLDSEEGQNWVIELEARGLSNQIIKQISDIQGVKTIERFKETIVADCDRDLRSEISATIVRGGASLLRLELKERTLDDIYRKHSEVV